jgi:hypothetical protein
MPRNTQIKPMKLVMSRSSETTWDMVVSIIEDGTLIVNDLNLLLLPEMINEVYFDNWQTQLENNPTLNIVEVERINLP